MRTRRPLLLRALLAALPIAIAACAHASTDERHGTGSTSDPGRDPDAATVTSNSKLGAKDARNDLESPGANLAKTVDPTPVPVSDASCPEGMILVEGDYCPRVEQTCLRYRDKPGTPFSDFRCEEYAKPAKCIGKRVHKRFCIDGTERTETGSDLPTNQKSWNQATAICKSDGGRLCMTSEWQFACEGEEMRPYPYGWERDSDACNVDIEHGLGRVGHLVDHRTPASAHPRCTSAFGVHDMAGNVDEWTTVDGAPRGKREVMHGSWWLPGRHACRQFQGGHGENYGGMETGVRCCKDAAAAVSLP